MTSLERTNSDIAGRLREQRRRERARRQVLDPIAAIDQVLAELEELHLLGRKRVPDEWAPRLWLLAGSLPPGVGPVDLPTRITITHLMDRLYDVQDALLRRKTGAVPDDELTG